MTTYVQVQPDSTGKKIQVFENTPDGTNTVEAQAVVSVTSTGAPIGIDGNPLVVRNRATDELLKAILAELKIHNYYMRELNPKLLADEPNRLSSDFSLVDDFTL